MKLRTGRHNGQIVYVQVGAEPSDGDPMLCVANGAQVAETLVFVVNEHASTAELLLLFSDAQQRSRS